MVHASDDEEREEPLDPAVERVRRKLVRFIAINLGILFFALMAVVAALVYRATRVETPPAAPVSELPAATGAPVYGEITLPRGARLVSQALSGGRLSLLVAQWPASVLARALAGQLGQALHVLSGEEHRWGPSDPLCRRFDRAGATALAEEGGFTVTAVEGTRTFSDVVPSAVTESDDALALLRELESRAAGTEELLALAAHLHLHATR